MSSSQRSIVHIGYHKTATKWFQTRIWPHIESHDYVQREVTQRALLEPPGLHFDSREARETLELGSRSRPVILSEENLSGYIHNGGLHGLMAPEAARRLKAVLPDARIVIFVRNQPDAIRASYSQYLAAGGTYSLRRYLDTHSRMKGAMKCAFKAPAFEWEHFEYDRLIAHYDQLFGRENVNVFTFEELRDRSALFGRMERELDIEIPVKSALAPASHRSQSSMATTPLRIANLFTRQSVVNKSWIIDLPGGHELRHAVNFLLKGLPGRPARLPADVKDEISRRFARSNQRSGRMRDLPLEQLGYDLRNPATLVSGAASEASRSTLPQAGLAHTRNLSARFTRLRHAALYTATATALAGCAEVVFDVI